MATRKKAKGKAKAKPRKAVAGKPAALKQAAKAGKKPAKKAPVRRASPVKAKPAAKPTPARTPAPPATAKPTPAGPVQPAAAWKPTPAEPVAGKPTPASAPSEPGERVGVVTHYYNHLGVAVVRLEAGTLRIGDTICIRGHTTDFTQRVASLEVEHAPVTEVGPSDDCALKVIAHAREHDVVYKVRP